MKSKNKLEKLFVVVFSFIFILQINFFLSGCKDETTSPNQPGENEIYLDNDIYSPATLNVSIGTTVKWINKEDAEHTVTSGVPGDTIAVFDSGDMQKDDEFTYTFTSAGTYPYYCRYHGATGMTGMVVVQ